ncbi:putative transcriptional regulator [Haloferula luteola]|uniref:Putative transcriptional regulator n=1 Tax=Haloferula luteola TaxID=595692 RepID=A0A840V3Q4_9BACT|nr:DUF3450 family protein [Haloferula luteola]MBB5350284.1 putative transcriptional regulator [Haloferula luteola]
MRVPILITALVPLLAVQVHSQEAQVSETAKLKESVREWIETMREIQTEETSWERDKELLEGQRDSLDSEIVDLKKRLDDARAEKAGADKESVDQVARRDALLKADETLAGKVRELESSLLAQLPLFPPPLKEDPRVKELMEQVQKDSMATGEEASKGQTKRLNNILNLLTEAEKWQQTVHLREELRTTPDGHKFNMQVVYFGLGCAYAVNEAGDYALVGTPSPSGWDFVPQNDLAPDILKMVAVLNGDADAQFITLPISLK